MGLSQVVMLCVYDLYDDLSPISQLLNKEISNVFQHEHCGHYACICL